MAACVLRRIRSTSLSNRTYLQLCIVCSGFCAALPPVFAFACTDQGTGFPDFLPPCCSLLIWLGTFPNSRTHPEHLAEAAKRDLLSANDLSDKLRQRPGHLNGTAVAFAHFAQLSSLQLCSFGRCDWSKLLTRHMTDSLDACSLDGSRTTHTATDMQTLMHDSAAAASRRSVPSLIGRAAMVLWR